MRKIKGSKCFVSAKRVRLPFLNYVNQVIKPSVATCIAKPVTMRDKCTSQGILVPVSASVETGTENEDILPYHRSY